MINRSLYLAASFLFFFATISLFIADCSDSDDSTNNFSFTPSATSTPIPDLSPTYTATEDVSFASLSIMTSPIDGQIFINDEFMGSGSWSGELLPGNYIISFGDYEGYYPPPDIIIELAAGESESVEGQYSQVPPTYGVINIWTTPVGLGNKLFCNGELAGIEFVSLEKQSGEYFIETETIAGYDTPQPVTLFLEVGETENISFTYTAQQATATPTVTSTPEPGTPTPTITLTPTPQVVPPDIEITSITPNILIMNQHASIVLSIANAPCTYWNVYSGLNNPISPNTGTNQTGGTVLYTYDHNDGSAGPHCLDTIYFDVYYGSSSQYLVSNSATIALIIRNGPLQSYWKPVH